MPGPQRPWHSERLLGAAAVGIKNLICITGDPPKMGNYRRRDAVFDVDADRLSEYRPQPERGWISAAIRSASGLDL